MAITDLTNTKWQLNEILYWDQSFNANINFISNSTEFNSISFEGNTNFSSEGDLILFDSVNMYYSYLNIYDGQTSEWESGENYRIIYITGGQDVTNSTLINWLQENAIQLSI